MEVVVSVLDRLIKEGLSDKVIWLRPEGSEPYLWIPRGRVPRYRERQVPRLSGGTMVGEVKEQQEGWSRKNGGGRRCGSRCRQASPLWPGGPWWPQLQGFFKFGVLGSDRARWMGALGLVPGRIS